MEEGNTYVPHDITAILATLSHANTDIRMTAHLKWSSFPWVPRSKKGELTKIPHCLISESARLTVELPTHLDTRVPIGR